MKALLQRAPIGILATVHDGQPFLNSNIFIYDETKHAIYLHTARLGRTCANIEIDDRVCFSVYEMGRLLPAVTALKFKCRVCQCRRLWYRHSSSDPKQATDALHLLLRKYAPHLQVGQDYRPVVPEELVRTSVYGISIEEWSGKKKEAPADFPGASTYSYLRILSPLSQG